MHNCLNLDMPFKRCNHAHNAEKDVQMGSLVKMYDVTNTSITTATLVTTLFGEGGGVATLATLPLDPPLC